MKKQTEQTIKILEKTSEKANRKFHQANQKMKQHPVHFESRKNKG